MLLGVLLAAIWSFLWFVVPERQGDPTAQAEARAAESLREVRAALVDFASAQGGAYPQQFEAVGERVRLAAQLAQSVNYQIQYTPGPVDADGTIRTFCAAGSRRKLRFPEFLSGRHRNPARHAGKPRRHVRRSAVLSVRLHVRHPRRIELLPAQKTGDLYKTCIRKIAGWFRPRAFTRTTNEHFRTHSAYSRTDKITSNAFSSGCLAVSGVQSPPQPSVPPVVNYGTSVIPGVDTGRPIQ